MSNLGREHWQAVKWILRYLKDTKNLGIIFKRQNGEACITDFVDLIMREICTSGGLLQVMFSLAVEDRYVGDLCSNQSVLYLLRTLNTWL